MKIPRLLKPIIIQRIKETRKASIIYGPRQSGKTTLANEIIQELGKKALIINGDDLTYNEVLSSRNSKLLNDLIYGYEVVFIDEAQRIKDIGINLKIIIDNNPNLCVIASGSSSFELANLVNEPLTGRKWTYKLFPISYSELSSVKNKFELTQELQDSLIFGSYPNIYNLNGSSIKKEYLQEITTDYLYKDIIMLDKLRDSSKIRALLRLLAFQIGSEVSLSELGRQLGMAKETVSRYIDLLEKSFVLVGVGGFSRNLRKEVSKSKKYYFYDLGIRNALIDNFNLISNRNDIGQLWENFLFVERLKRNSYALENSSYYYWRTYTNGEIDYIEEKDGKLSGYEFKWTDSKAKLPKIFLETYQNSSIEIVNKDNFLDFVL